MATFSTHILSSLDGTHLSDVLISLVEIPRDGNKKLVFQEKTDSGGRMTIQFLPKIGKGFEYQIIVSMPESFDIIGQKGKAVKNANLSSISLGIKFENTDATYHMPFLLSPNGFSGWVSR